MQQYCQCILETSVEDPGSDQHHETMKRIRVVAHNKLGDGRTDGRFRKGLQIPMTDGGSNIQANMYYDVKKEKNFKCAKKEKNRSPMEKGLIGFLTFHQTW